MGQGGQVIGCVCGGRGAGDWLCVVEVCREGEGINVGVYLRGWLSVNILKGDANVNTSFRSIWCPCGPLLQ